MAAAAANAATASVARGNRMAKKTDKTARKQNVTASEGAAPAQEAEKEVLSEEEARALLEGRNRIHAEALGQQWAVVLGGNPAQLMPSTGKVSLTVLFSFASIDQSFCRQGYHAGSI